MKRNLLAILAVISVTTLSAFAQERSAPTLPSQEKAAKEDAPVFGPYQAITFNKDILRDVKVDEKNDVYLQLYPKHKNKELVVKLSNEYFASYREWHHGGYELVSPANSGKPDYAWTDWVNTQATYIEYWMDGEVFLHLKRIDR